MCPKKLLSLLSKFIAPDTGIPFSLMGLEVGEALKYVPSRSLSSLCWNNLSLSLSGMFSLIFEPLGFVTALSFSISSQNTLLHPQVLSFLIPSLLTPCQRLPTPSARANAYPCCFLCPRNPQTVFLAQAMFIGCSQGSSAILCWPGSPNEVLRRFLPIENQLCIPWGCLPCCFCCMVLASHQCTSLEGRLTLSSKLLYLCLQQSGGNLYINYITYMATGHRSGNRGVSVPGHKVAQLHGLPFKIYCSHSTAL